MATRMHLQILTVTDEESDDWIKNIVGDDGLTAREREEQVYQEVKRLQEAERKQGASTETDKVTQ